MNPTAASTNKADRPCTCHPDDNPPNPCAGKYALNECRAAEVDRLIGRNKYDPVGRALDYLVANGELDDYDSEIANRVRDAAKIIRAVSRLHHVPLSYLGPGTKSGQ